MVKEIASATTAYTHTHMLSVEFHWVISAAECLCSKFDMNTKCINICY